MYNFFLIVIFLSFNTIIQADEKSSFKYIWGANSKQDIFSKEIKTQINKHKSNKAKEYNLWKYISNRYSLPDHDHPHLEGHLKWFVKNPDYLTRVTKRATPYLYLIVKEVEKQKVPFEIALLPIVESAFYPFAYSVGGASGLWQFTSSTGKIYGLEQNWWYDARRDILKSTKAAIRYLKELNKYFNGDWLLAIAAYNSGPGRVEKEIAKNKRKAKKTDFWNLSLPLETRGYVPRLLAVSELIKYPKKYGQTITKVKNKAVLNKVWLRSQTDLSLISSLTGLELDDIYNYNPGFNRWATPPGKGHHILLPINLVDNFKTELSKYPNELRMKWLRHKIKKGDSLEQIAKKYKTSTKALKTANKLKNNMIRIDDYLIIPVPKKEKSYYSLSEEERLQQRLNVEKEGKKIIHTVVDGDSLWKIGKTYGVYIANLTKWNKISLKEPLQIGKKLVLWQKKTKQVNIEKVISVKSGIERKINYKVREGDNLSKIANKFKVNVKDIQKWNNLTPNKVLKIGKKLTIHIDVANVSK